MSDIVVPKTVTPVPGPVAEAPFTPLTRWKRIRYRLETLGANILASLIPLLPLKAVQALGRFVGGAAYYAMGSARQVAQANLDLVFGNTKSVREKSRIARISCQNFATTLLTFFWSPRLNQQSLAEAVEVDETSLENVRRIQAGGKPIIFITLHYGDWEMLGLATSLYGFKSTVVTRTMRNGALEEIFARLRGLTGNRIIPRRHAAAKLLKALKRGECTALLIDQHVPVRLGGIWCDFFGVPVLTTPAIAQLALHSNAAIIAVVARPVPGQRMRIRYGPEIPYTSTGDKTADIQAITQKCLDFCETTIREQPEYWLWSYKRWKARPSQDQGRYPFYSRVAKQPPR